MCRASQSLPGRLPLRNAIVTTDVQVMNGIANNIPPHIASHVQPIIADAGVQVAKHQTP